MVITLSVFPRNIIVVRDTLIQLGYSSVSVLPGEFYSSYQQSHKRSRPTHVGGQIITAVENQSIMEVRRRISNFRKGNHSKTMMKVSDWLWDCSDVDIVRFLRGQKGNIDNAWMRILAHAEWRIGPSGADQILKNEHLYASAAGLHQEIFWLDVGDVNNCPTVVVRALLHDGKHYDDDPQKFTNFLVYLLEIGRERLGVGKERMACLILDRFPIQIKNTEGDELKSQEIFDLSVIPNIVVLLRFTKFITCCDIMIIIIVHA